MENNEIKAGDCVYLKGDEEMIFTVGDVTTVSSLRQAKIFWFDHTTQELKERYVPVQALAKVEGK